MTLVTVVIPTRNRRDMLGECLRGVLRQEGVDLEVIVVDDGSIDATASFVTNIGDPRVRLVRHETSRGVSAARNSGIDAARGEWVAFSDDDDLWAPCKLRVQLDRAAQTHAGFVYCGALVFSADSPLVEPDREVPPADRLLEMLYHWNPLPGGASAQMARLGVLRQLGGFDTAFHLLADWDMWLRLAEATRPAAVDEALVAYRRHPTNMARGRGLPMVREAEQFAAKYRVAAREHGTALAEANFCYWIGNGQVLAGHPLGAAAVYSRGAFKLRNPRMFARMPAVVTLAAKNRIVGCRQTKIEAMVPAPAWLSSLLQ